MGLFDDLKDAFEEAIELESGKRTGSRIHQREFKFKEAHLSPEDIAELRKSLGMNQLNFAHFLNVSVNTVKSWEQGRSQPSGASLRLLQMVELYPEAKKRLRA